jgi:cytidine deaminase
MELTSEDKKLIEKAKELLNKINNKSVGTACALISSKGNIYFGVNLGVENPSAVCAEPIALGNMITHGENEVKTMVAYQEKGIVSPCGVCRELLYELKIGNPWIIINNNEKTKLNELLPHPCC